MNECEAGMASESVRGRKRTAGYPCEDRMGRLMVLLVVIAVSSHLIS